MNPLAPWQQRPYDHAAEALDAGRLPHALLCSGPEGIGKRRVAERLARRLLCPARISPADACGECRSCRLFDSRHQLDAPETRPDGRLVHPDGHPAHPDVRFVGFEWNTKVRPPRMRTEIVVDQIRAMNEKLSLTPQYGEHLVALLEPADALNHNAANALLKTLEEPQPGRFIWLVSAHPTRLPATIRSRTQVLDFRLPAREEALAWLVSSGHAPALAEEALRVAGGHPGLADRWLAEGVLPLRREVAEGLSGLRPQSVAALAQQWAADDRLELRLAFAADVALESARGASPARARALARWFDHANRTRALQRTTVRMDLAVVELLLAWCALPA